MRQINDYSLLACAIAGRKIGVHVSASDNESAYSDGQTIYLSPAVVSSDAGLFAVIAQASLIGGRTYKSSVLKKLIGRKALARQYTFFEVLRCTRALSLRLPRTFLGELERFASIAVADSPENSLRLAQQRNLPEIPDYFGTVKPLAALRSGGSDDQPLSEPSAAQAAGQFESKPQREFDDDDNAEESKFLKLFQNPFSSSSSFLADMLNDILGAGANKGGQEAGMEGGGDEIPVGRVEQAMRRSVKSVLAKLPFELPDVESHSEDRAQRYPEWDVYKKRYKKDWAVVEEVEAWRPDGEGDQAVFIPTHSREMQRQLAALGVDHEMHRRQPEGADLDEGRLIDVAIDLSCGFSPAALDIYRASRRTRRDLAVAIALDISGSTGESDQTGRSVFDRQLSVAYQLTRSLSQLGDTVALFGFHSWGRNLVRSVRLKGHEEPWSGMVSERMSRLEPYGYTRTGTAIRHGSRLLQESMRLPNRLFILITDGIAYDQDYEQHYAEADARKALEECHAAGTACVCLCVGGTADGEKLEAVFGSANLLMVNEPEEVTPRIRKTCAQALLRAGGRH